MKIGELARRLDISTSKLRFLETRGLLRAKRLRSGYRDYDEHAVEVLRLILMGQRFGFSLDEIATAFPEGSGRLRCEVLVPKFTARLAALDSEIDRLTALRVRVGGMLKELQVSKPHNNGASPRQSRKLC